MTSAQIHILVNYSMIQENEYIIKRKLIQQIISNDSIPNKGFRFNEIKLYQATKLGMTFTTSEVIGFLQTDPLTGFVTSECQIICVTHKQC